MKMARILIGSLSAVLVWIIFSLTGPSVGLRPSQAQESNPGRRLEDLIARGSNTTRLLGLVRGGEFSIIHPEQLARRELRLTTIRVADARLPEGSQLDLSPYEGGLIMVEGIDQGRWLYEAKVIDRASPIMMTVISELFGGARVRRLQ